MERQPFISRWDRQQRPLRLARRGGLLSQRPKLGLTSWKRLFRYLLISLAVIAILPPLYFHFKLRRFHQVQERKCSWLRNPPLICAHGGDSSKAFPNTITAYQIALSSQVDCIEVDVSRSSDGVLFALHDRDLQRISGNDTSKVGYLSSKEIKELFASHKLQQTYHDLGVPTIEDALKLISGSVQQVILDIKIGPPLYEKGLAGDVVSSYEKLGCKNCVVWAKSDNIPRDVLSLAPDAMVGYIVMMDPSTGTRSQLLRMRGAGVVGVYHPLIDNKLVKTLHARNKKVYAWTVDDEESMNKMLIEHADAIVTSNPSALKRVMQAARAQCLGDGFSFSAQ
ncbi:glycerophosphodiester phosphodiesterase GDPD4 [Ipomoea triloba]|uniref:glycerophosphodiester phosphodiesterase GDPD4 n=1 Tax=Ipomoea triloba TaxID=35885 RepID=UPI00125DE231|nr:glycerophosphodiester phosphodiesterase GDPD4 [Ipomoea triloba]